MKEMQFKIECMINGDFEIQRVIVKVTSGISKQRFALSTDWFTVREL